MVATSTAFLFWSAEMPKKTEKPKMPAPAAAPKMRHIQIQIPDDAYQRGKKVARENGLSLTAYTRQALLQRIRADAGEIGGGSK
jgi:hypothetical protein